MEVIYSSKFIREYKKLPAHVKDAFEDCEKLFRQNPFDVSLKTHKLSGKLSGFLALSVDFKYRIIFEFDKNKKVIYLHSVGDHGIYE